MVKHNYDEVCWQQFFGRLSIPNWRQRIETRHFAIGVACWVTSFCLRSDSV